MCWESKEVIKYNVKDKNGKKVFKFALMDVDKKIIVPYFFPKENFKYKVGETKKEKIGDVKVNVGCYMPFSINEGLHSYDMKLCNYFRNKNDSDMIHVNGKRESVSAFVYKTRGMHLCLLECTIPFGTNFYENVNGEIVSEALTVDKATDFKFIDA